MSRKMYAIAVDSFQKYASDASPEKDLDQYVIAVSQGGYNKETLLRYKTRFWGAGDCIYLWANAQQAVDYLSDLDDGYFHDKYAIMDDADVVEVDRDEIEGEIIEPSWTEPKYSDEGYDTPMILMMKGDKDTSRIPYRDKYDREREGETQ